MFFLLGTRCKVQRVRGGRRLEADCPECGVTGMFYECVRTETVNAFAIVDLLSSSETVYTCGNCGDVFQLASDADASRRSPSTDTRADRAAQQAEASRAAEARRRAEQAAEARRVAEQAADARRRAEQAAEDRRAAAKRARRVEDELAALKRKLGRN